MNVLIINNLVFTGIPIIQINYITDGVKFSMHIKIDCDFPKELLHCKVSMFL